MMDDLEGAPSVPRSTPALPGGHLNGVPNELWRFVTMELQGHIDYHWEQQQDQWYQLRKELREQHQELLQQLQVPMRHDDVKMVIDEQYQEVFETTETGLTTMSSVTPTTGFDRQESPIAEHQTARSSMFNWTTARLKKAERQTSKGDLSVDRRCNKWLKRMFIVPPSFKKKRAANTVVGKFAESIGFLVFSGSLIISNSIYLGWYADFSVKNELRRIDGGSSDQRPWIGNIIFSVLLVLEVSIRFFGLGWKRYLGANAWWNVIDLVLVILLVFSFFQPKDRVPGSSFLRILRLFRLIHTFPVFRLPLFAHLRMITNALLMSIPSFLWAVTFGSMFLYMSGVGFCLGLAHELQVRQAFVAGGLPARAYFSNLGDAMKHLYMSLTNGIDWIQIYDATEDCDPIMSMGLLVFSVFMVFAVVNIISAMFIERAFNVIRDDRDFWVVEEARRRRQHRRRIFGLFDEMDKDGSGDVTWDEFERALNNPHIEAYLSFVDLDVSNLHDIFQLLDKDKNGSVDLHEFLDGLEVLKGPAKRVEVLRMYDLVRDLLETELHTILYHQWQNITSAGGDAPKGRWKGLS